MTDPLELLRSALGDRYAIERELGQGGMATVYLARDLKHERRVAVKVLRPELSASLGADRFLREIRVAATLQHPNVLGLYDSGEASGLLYYVMPFIEGESLRDRLNREQQLPLHDALQITREAAEALAYAHGQGIIHRDIKPENILLQQGHALVADFGIARAVSQAGGEKLTQTGMAVGTPHYMSPEQSLGSDHVDARSDVYSLGCVLYELLIGEPPFQGPNAMAILARHAMEPVPSLQVVRQSVPDEVEDAVLQSLEKTPADRFQSMGEFVDALLDAEANAALQRTASRRAATAQRTGATKAATAARRTGTRTVAVKRKTPVELAAAAIREGGVKFWSLSAMALALLAVLGWGGWRLLHNGGAAASEEPSGLDPNRLAVLYFEKSQGGSDSLSYLADGLTEALIHELSDVGGLQVVSSNGVRPYRKGDVPLQKIAQELHVGTLVHGGISQSGSMLRLNVSLIDAGSGIEIGNRRLERPREEIFALQDDLAKEVSEFLRQQLGKEVKLAESRSGTGNVKAWEVLQKGLAEADNADPLIAAGDTAAASRQYDQADSLLAQAETLDPKWAVPPTRRGWLAYRRGRLVGSVEKSSNVEWTTGALAHAGRALELKPNDPDALELKGTLLYWRWLLNLEPDPKAAAKLLTDAESALRASLAANAAQASAWNTLSHLLLNKSQTAEAKLAALRAYESDPYLANANLTLFRLFSTSVDLEDAIEANHWCEEGHRRFPQEPNFTECQIWLLFMKKAKPDIPKAWALLDQYIQLQPPDAREYERLRGQMIVAAVIARAAATSNQEALRDSARSVLVHARTDASTDPTRELAMWEAIGRTILGDKDEAFSQLSLYFATNPQLRASLDKERTWWFEDLRGDPRWKALMGAGR